MWTPLLLIVSSAILCTLLQHSKHNVDSVHIVLNSCFTWNNTLVYTGCTLSKLVPILLLVITTLYVGHELFIIIRDTGRTLSAIIIKLVLFLLHWKHIALICLRVSYRPYWKNTVWTWYLQKNDQWGLCQQQIKKIISHSCMFI